MVIWCGTVALLDRSLLNPCCLFLVAYFSLLLARKEEKAASLGLTLMCSFWLDSPSCWGGCLILSVCWCCPARACCDGCRGRTATEATGNFTTARHTHTQSIQQGRR
ncbi:hypothetical protein B0I35DRAFT_74406 [Stachybotrys elegans]|uniref:Uncharacterized protein n=1 Tax=Stachybotrys elegans TaxID=80388 RepID=A0A8K0SHM6_9HYPO|nr:hypothetical protein B0I35DRAFT_74406 [Stachybotrys elegans]